MSAAVVVAGLPGVGKTTAILEAARCFSQVSRCGIVTRERRLDGRRDGFELQLLDDSQSGLLAHPDLPGDTRFGSLRADGTRRLGVDLRFLEETACPAIRAALPHSRLVVLDELGPMQALSPAFRALVEVVIDSPVVLVASAASPGDDWTRALLARAGVRPLLLDRSPGSYDTTVERVTAHVLSALK